MFAAQALATGTDKGTGIASRVASKADGQEFSRLEQHNSVAKALHRDLKLN